MFPAGSLGGDLLRELLRGVPSAVAGLVGQHLGARPATEEVSCEKLGREEVEQIRQVCLEGRFDATVVVSLGLCGLSLGLGVGYLLGRWARPAAPVRGHGRRGVFA